TLRQAPRHLQRLARPGAAWHGRDAHRTESHAHRPRRRSVRRRGPPLRAEGLPGALMNNAELIRLDVQKSLPVTPRVAFLGVCDRAARIVDVDHTFTRV